MFKPCLGTKLGRLINFMTLGTGKGIAVKIAGLFGFSDCGCDRRSQWLNKTFGCDEGIKL